MDLTLTEDQELIKSTATELLSSRAETAGARAVAEDPTGYSAALWKEMTELGWTGLAVPEAYGGVGVGFLEVCLLVEEMGRHQVPSPFLPTVACSAPVIAGFAAEEQKRDWLGAIARGGVVSPVPARWDRSGSGVTAVRTGDGYTLDGVASFVPYAHAAEYLLVTADLPAGDAAPAPSDGAGVAVPADAGVAPPGEAGVALPADAGVAPPGEARMAASGDDAGVAPAAGGGRTVLLVEAAAAGVTVEPLTAIGSGRPCRVTFSGVTVPADRALAEGAAEAITAYGTAATCAEMVGGAQRVLDMTLAYAAEREQFGKPIGSFQAVQHHCANMATDVLSSRFIAYEAIWRLAEGLDATAEVSMAKAWTGEAYERVCALGHQVHGAIGFTAEHDLHLYSAHATAAALTFGDPDHHWSQVATHLGLP